MIVISKILIRILLMMLPILGICQKQVGIEYGRAFFRYRDYDYGDGFRKQNASNYDLIVGLTYDKEISTNFFWQTGVYFTQYQQYYSTKKYTPAYDQSYPILQIPARIGIMPDNYIAEYQEILVYPIFDSMTRGEIKRNYSFIFPLVDLGGGISYRVS